MPCQRLTMREVREVLRLKHVCCHSGHQMAALVGVGRYTVAEYPRRAATLIACPQPDWARIYAQLRRPGMTVLLLWEKYRAG